MKVIICENIQEMSLKAASIFAQRIREKPDIVLGLATGGTPVRMYQELIRMHREEGLDFSSVTTFNLDEYVGLAPHHEQSYHYFMNQNLFNSINIDKKRTYIMNGVTDNPIKECEEFEKKIKTAGGIDLQLLGIGRNGHIAFNEPDSSELSRTRLVNLSSHTIKDNSRFFKNIDEVPKQALSMGIGTIMEAREIVLLASGKNKSQAVSIAIEEPITDQVPASFLQKHSNCTFIIDRDAESELKHSY